MKMGKMYEVALTVEGYQSSGSADVYKNVITVGGSIPSDPGGSPSNPSNPAPPTNSALIQEVLLLQFRQNNIID